MSLMLRRLRVVWILGCALGWFTVVALPAGAQFDPKALKKSAEAAARRAKKVVKRSLAQRAAEGARSPPTRCSPRGGALYKRSWSRWLMALAFR
jgi:hypothetical protein